MSYRYDDLYKVFNDELIQRYNIDWFDVFKNYLEIGNYCGLYPDTALALMMLIDKNPIKKIVEFGAGASTLFLKKACLANGAEIDTYEESKKYLDMTKKLLEKYSLDTDFIKQCPCEDIDLTGVDMVFIDSSESQRIKLLRESKTIADVPLVVMDDFGSPGLALALSVFIKRCATDRPIYVYNGVGRQDRHLALCWLPDKINSISELIAQNIPRIGVS